MYSVNIIKSFKEDPDTTINPLEKEFCDSQAALRFDEGF